MGSIAPLNAANAERGKKKVPPALVAHAFKPGQSGNPGGRTASFAECQQLAREASPDAMRRLIELMASPDERVALVAADKVLERAWGKPKEYDPDASGKRFSEMAPEERAREIERIFKLAREVIDREKAIESEAERVYVLGSTEAARFSGEG